MPLDPFLIADQAVDTRYAYPAEWIQLFERQPTVRPHEIHAGLLVHEDPARQDYPRFTSDLAVFILNRA